MSHSPHTRRSVQFLIRNIVLAGLLNTSGISLEMEIHQEHPGVTHGSVLAMAMQLRYK